MVSKACILSSSCLTLAVDDEHTLMPPLFHPKSSKRCASQQPSSTLAGEAARMVWSAKLDERGRKRTRFASQYLLCEGKVGKIVDTFDKALLGQRVSISRVSIPIHGHAVAAADAAAA